MGFFGSLKDNFRLGAIEQRFRDKGLMTPRAEIGGLIDEYIELCMKRSTTQKFLSDSRTIAYLEEAEIDGSIFMRQAVEWVWALGFSGRLGHYDTSGNRVLLGWQKGRFVPLAFVSSVHCLAVFLALKTGQINDCEAWHTVTRIGF